MEVNADSKDYEVIIAQADGTELGIIDDADSIDMDIHCEARTGPRDSKNTFEIIIDSSTWKRDRYIYGNRIFVPGTEYGGIIGTIQSVTANDSIHIGGQTWRGLLHNHIVEPPENETHLVLSGDLNTVLSEITHGIEPFVVTDELTGISVSGWKAVRYASIYETITKLFSQYDMRLNIKYNQLKKVVELSAVSIVDYSKSIEYSQDSKVDFNIKDDRTGVNHLICGGQGEGIERLILHLFVQEDGSISTTPYYTGKEEIAAFYDYRNAADEEALMEAGINKLKELQNYKSFSMSVDNIDLEVGDIVGGREYITGTELQKPVIQKIFKKNDNGVFVSYKMKGEN